MTKVVYLPKPFIVKPYTKKELIHIMEVSPHILTRWLAAIPNLGEPIAKQYSVKQVQLIVETYGLPGQLVNEAA